MPKTLEQIRQEGLEALRQRLGRAGMIRFLQQFETGRGDYAKERHAWVDAESLADIRKATTRRPKRQSSRRGRS
jgi:hypothetical protein